MKYKLTENTKIVDGITLYQIQALTNFGDIKSGNLGGWIEKESNLSQEGSCWVYGNAWVYCNALVSGNARVYGDAQVYGNAWVYDNAVIAQHQHINFNRVVNDITDIKSNLIENIEAQTGLKCFNNEIYCYKHVRSDLSSLHDSNFKYTVGEYVTVEDIDLDQTKSCSNGLHVSNAQYWNGRGGEVVLFCRVHVDDIISVQEGKIRCRKLFVIGVCDGQVF